MQKCIDHPAGLKMADKAALLVQTVPRDRLLETLASGSQEPPTKRAKRGSAQAASSVAPQANRSLTEFSESREPSQSKSSSN